MRIFMLFIIAFKISSCDNSELIREYYDSGELKSEIIIYDESKFCATLYYENGIIKEKGCFVNEKPDGLNIEYYINGNTKKEITYVDGEVEGKVSFYHLSGELYQEKWFLSGKSNYSQVHEDSMVFDQITPNLWQVDNTNNGVGDSLTIMIGLPFDESLPYYNKKVHIHFKVSPIEDSNDYINNEIDSLQIILDKDHQQHLLRVKTSREDKYFKVLSFTTENRKYPWHSSIPISTIQSKSTKKDN